MISAITKPIYVFREKALSVTDLFLYLYRSTWTVENHSGITYQFMNLEIEENALSGMLYLGDKLLDFEIEEKHIIHKSFRIGKYIFLITSSDTLTVFVNNESLDQLHLKRTSSL